MTTRAVRKMLPNDENLLQGKAMSDTIFPRRIRSHYLTIPLTRTAFLAALAVAGCGIDPFLEGPPAGNPAGTCAVPSDAQAEDVTKPDHVVGTGTPESCTSDAFVSAVAQGGVITFNCGPGPVTITLDRTAKLSPTSKPKTVIDGGGKVALSGGRRVRILYQDTCESMPSTSCDGQGAPLLAVQNLTFVDGAACGQDLLGGGALYIRGGRLKVVNSRFFRNVCEAGDWMGGGGAIRALLSSNWPAYIVNSTFGGQEGLGNTGINGGAVSSIFSDWTIINSLMSFNQAAPASLSSGGAISAYSVETLNLCGSLLTDNVANGAGGAIFFGGSSHGRIYISNSILRNNKDTSNVSGHPSIETLGEVIKDNSTVE